MRKSSRPHDLHLQLEDSQITESLCSCKAGLSGHCSHVVGLIKTLQGLKLHMYTHVPVEQSCTSMPQQWSRPRGNRINPIPLSSVVVAKPSEQRKRRPILCQVDTNTKLPRITPADISTLQNLEGTPLAYIMSPDVPMVSCPLGAVQQGSVLSYQIRKMQASPDPMMLHSQCKVKPLPQESFVELQPDFKYLNSSYSVDTHKLECQTRGQANCQLWVKERRSRLTSSNFGRVLLRKAVPSTSFLNSIFCPKNIRVASLDYGRHNEPHAKEKYLSLFPGRHIHECGLVVNNNFSFLGASPDGKLCDDNTCGIIEIKCPFSARNMFVDEACFNLPNFCLHKENETTTLKRDHEYYSQVQGQLMITGVQFCDFVVFTQKDLFVERISPDIPYMSDLLGKLAKFFKCYAVPYFREE